MRNLQFTSCSTAITTIWNWGFTFQGLNIFSAYVGIDASGADNTGPNAQPWASMSVIDSVFSSVLVGILLPGNDVDAAMSQILLDNLQVTDLPGTTTVVGLAGGAVIESTSADTQYVSWSLGTTYLDFDGPVSSNYSTAQTLPPPQKPAVLLASNGSIFAQSKPQYETLSVESFVDVKTYGAMGNGGNDDTAAINYALGNCSSMGLVCYFPMGVYMVSDTVLVPVNSRIVGIGYPQIMATGDNFNDPTNPTVMVQVGNLGESGMVEIQDMLFTVEGPAAGAVLMEWNVAQDEQGSAAMWDSHFRVGGAIPTNLREPNCPKLTGVVNSACMGAWLGLFITPGSSGYFENVWVWTGMLCGRRPPLLSGKLSAIC